MNSSESTTPASDLSQNIFSELQKTYIIYPKISLKKSGELYISVQYTSQQQGSTYIDCNKQTNKMDSTKVFLLNSFMKTTKISFLPDRVYRELSTQNQHYAPQQPRRKFYYKYRYNIRRTSSTVKLTRSKPPKYVITCNTLSCMSYYINCG